MRRLATGLAALKQQIVLTGHGLKDPGTAVEQAGAPIRLSASLEAYVTK